MVATGFMTLLALLLASVGTFVTMRNFLLERVDRTLSSAAMPISHAVSNGLIRSGCNNPQHLPPAIGGAGDSTVFPRKPLSAVTPFSSIFIEVRRADGTTLFKCRAYSNSHPVDASVPSRAATLASLGHASSTFVNTKSVGSGPRMRLFEQRLANGDLLYLGTPLNEVDATLTSLMWIEFIVSLTALLFIVGAVFLIVSSGLKPLRRVEATASAISSGQFDERVPGEDHRSEAGRLAITLNSMLGQIESAIADRDALVIQLQERDLLLRQFVADASHELRTPITAISAFAELFDRGASSRSDDLARLLKGIALESARMQKLVDDLLILARFDEGVPTEREPVELVQLVNRAISTSLTVGPDWPVTFTATEPVEVLGSENQLLRVVDNVLANVRAHTPPGTSTLVRVRKSGDAALMEFTDDGPGMSPEDAARAFDRFYRASQGRDRTHGGSGLGLSIVGAIVAAHGGTARIEASRADGVRVVIELPLAL